MRALFLTFLLIAQGFGYTNAQSVVTATSGSGAYKNDIKWLNFADLAEISAGSGLRVSKNFYIGDVEVTVEIRDVGFSGTLSSAGGALANQRLVKYNSGKWQGDGLVRLYNIGATNNSATIADRAKNTLFNALANKYDGNYVEGVTSTFTIRVYATLNGQAMDLGLVYATAEDDGIGNSGGYTEYTQGATNGSAWQLLEKNVNDPSGLQRITFSNTNHTARSSCGRGNAAIMYTKKPATSVSAPLEVNISMLSGGNSAVALGVLTSADIGDAPISYGTPANTSFYDITGGNPSAASGTFTNYLSATGTGGSPVINAGTPTEPPRSSLGILGGDADPADVPSLHSATANIDDNTGVDDEDALSAISPLNVNTSSYSLSFPASSTASSPAYVTAWIDFDRDGIFSASEYKSYTVPTNTTQNITFIWTGLSPSLLRSGVSYIRLRVSLYNSANADNYATAVDERSTMALSGGETEDYAFDITSTISGNLFNDANGLQGIPANTVDGTLISAPSGIQQYISLVSASNTVLQTVAVSGGAYAFTGPYFGSYYLVVSNAVGGSTVATNLPAGWVYTGERQAANASGAGSDGSPNGNLSITTTGTDTYTKFGIERRPESNSQLLNITKPLTAGVLYNFPSLNTNVPVPQLSGSDPEDKPASTTDSISSGGTFTITTLPPPAQATLYYNNTVLVAGAAISNYDPSKLQIVFASTSVLATAFYYTITDAAGFSDLSPAVYQINLLTLLPVTGLHLSVRQQEGKVLLLWQTISETNTSHFHVEQSTDGTNYLSIGRVPAANNSNIPQYYSFTHTPSHAAETYYRIVLHNQHGEKNFSNIERINIYSNVTLQPNTASSYAIVSGLAGQNAIHIVNAAGQTVQSATTSNPVHTLHISHLIKGLYWVKIIQAQKVIKVMKLLKE